jgi:hypothetical protein
MYIFEERNLLVYIIWHAAREKQAHLIIYPTNTTPKTSKSSQVTPTCLCLIPALSFGWQGFSTVVVAEITGISDSERPR